MLTNFSGNTGAAIDGYYITILPNTNPTTEKKLSFAAVSNGELTCVFEEKWSFFRKKQVKPVEVDLLLIGFHLCKIRIVGQIKREAGCNGILDIKTKLRIRIRAVNLTTTTRPDQAVRGDFQVPD